jgi:hypothetical protein
MSAKETIAKLIRDEFDRAEWYDDQKLNELILTAKSYGLDELANEMEYDLR